MASEKERRRLALMLLLNSDLKLHSYVSEKHLVKIGENNSSLELFTLVKIVLFSPMITRCFSEMQVRSLRHVK